MKLILCGIHMSARWNEMFERLVEYKKKNGSTNVPHTYKEDPELASWVYHRRQKRELSKKGLKSWIQLDLCGGLAESSKSSSFNYR